jgi:F0F1-type ATP synthase gamma subunit
MLTTSEPGKSGKKQEKDPGPRISDELAQEIFDAYDNVKAATARLEEAKTEAKNCREYCEEQQELLASVLERAESGQEQTELFKP